MLLAFLLMMQSASLAEDTDLLDERYSAETESAYLAYITCIGLGVHERREQEILTENDAEKIRAVCQTDADKFAESFKRDFGGITSADNAANLARTFLDKVDPGAIFMPKAPASLAKLRVSQLVGRWQNGRGVLATRMDVRFSRDGALVGTITPGYEGAIDGLTGWTILGDGTEDAVLRASFTDGKFADYQSIPSFPGEMTFSNSSDPRVQRFDLAVEDGTFVLRYVKPGIGTELLFQKRLERERSSEDERLDL